MTTPGICLGYGCNPHHLCAARHHCGGNCDLVRCSASSARPQILPRRRSQEYEPHSYFASNQLPTCKAITHRKFTPCCPSAATIPTDLLYTLNVQFLVASAAGTKCDSNGYSDLTVTGELLLLSGTVRYDFGMALWQDQLGGECEAAYGFVVKSNKLADNAVAAPGASFVAPYGVLEDSKLQDLDGDSCADAQGPFQQRLELTDRARARCNKRGGVDNVKICMFWADDRKSQCKKIKHVFKRAQSG